MSRRARICAISMNSLVHGDRSRREDRAREAEEKICRGALDAPDLFLLPETFLVNDVPGAFTDPANIDDEGNETYRWLGGMARTNRAYVAAPLLTRRGGRVRNSTVIFDRDGRAIYTYDKTHPTPGEVAAGIAPGAPDQSCVDVDFGRIGVAICYDLNFQPLMAHYHRQGIEVLLFPSYFPGGMLLQTWAFLYMFHAVGSHAQGHDSMFVDLTGRVVARANMFSPALTHEFELDSVVVPYWGNHEAIAAAKRRHAAELDVDVYRDEGDAALRYRGTATSVRALLAEFSIRTRAQMYGQPGADGAGDA